jgi:ribosomal protein S25
MQFSGEEREANLELIEKLWPIFEERIPDDAAALNFVRQTLLENSAIHCQCGLTVKKKYQSKKPRTLICKNCKKEIWFTAKTPFKRAERLKAWLGAIFLMGNGAVVTSNKLAALGGTAISTALNIVRTIGLVLEHERHLETTNRSFSVPSAEFISIFCRRSLLTLPKVHPSTEIEENAKSETKAEQGRAEQRPQATTTEHLSESEKEIFELITAELITQDQICQSTTLPVSAVASALVILEIEGLIQAHAGGRFSRRSCADNNNKTEEKTNPLAAMSLVGRTIDSTLSIRGGISRKYLQIYLAAIWCHFDRRRWSEEKLLLAVLQAPSITYKDILNYESPPLAAMVAITRL